MIEGLGCLAVMIACAAYAAYRNTHRLGVLLRFALGAMVLGAGLRAVGLLSLSFDYAWINGDLVRIGRAVMPWASAVMILSFVRPRSLLESIALRREEALERCRNQ